MLRALPACAWCCAWLSALGTSWYAVDSVRLFVQGYRCLPDVQLLALNDLCAKKLGTRVLGAISTGAAGVADGDKACHIQVRPASCCANVLLCLGTQCGDVSTSCTPLGRQHRARDTTAPHSWNCACQRV
jgi:hypothetical protein